MHSRNVNKMKEKKEKQNTTQDVRTKPACSTSVNNGFCFCHHHQEENMRNPARKKKRERSQPRLHWWTPESDMPKPGHYFGVTSAMTSNDKTDDKSSCNGILQMVPAWGVSSAGYQILMWHTVPSLKHHGLPTFPSGSSHDLLRPEGMDRISRLCLNLSSIWKPEDWFTLWGCLPQVTLRNQLVFFLFFFHFC